MSFFRSALLFMLFTFTRLLIAEPKASEVKRVSLKIEDLRKIQAKLQDYRYLTLDFKQTIYKKLRDKTLSNQGEVYFKKPSSFRWVFKQSEPEEWIYDGSDLLHYFPSRGYAHRYKAQAAKGKNLKEIVSMVLDFNSLLERYKVSSSFQEGSIVNLTLDPKDRGEITQVSLILNLATNSISEVKLSFEGGNRSVFAFSNPRYNENKLGFGLPAKVKVSDAI